MCLEVDTTDDLILTIRAGDIEVPSIGTLEDSIGGATATEVHDMVSPYFWIEPPEVPVLPSLDEAMHICPAWTSTLIGVDMVGGVVLNEINTDTEFLVDGRGHDQQERDHAHPSRYIENR